LTCGPARSCRPFGQTTSLLATGDLGLSRSKSEGSTDAARRRRVSIRDTRHCPGDRIADIDRRATTASLQCGTSQVFVLFLCKVVQATFERIPCLRIRPCGRVRMGIWCTECTSARIACGVGCCGCYHGQQPDGHEHCNEQSSHLLSTSLLMAEQQLSYLQYDLTITKRTASESTRFST
jgi:hypothetical protein